jgi:WD40 repeat protein
MAVGVLAAVAVSAAVLCIPSRRGRILTFADSKAFFANEFSRDGSLLLGRIYRGRGDRDPVAVWDVATGELLSRFADFPRHARFTADGQIAFMDKNGPLIFRDPVTWSERVTVVSGLSGEAQLALSANGRFLATTKRWEAHAKARVRLWDLTTGKNRVLIDEAKRECPITVLQFSPDGQQLGTVSWNGIVRIWDTATGAERGRYKTSNDTAPTGCWLSPTLDKVVRSGYWLTISRDLDNNEADARDETTLWALPPLTKGSPLELQAARLVKRVGFTHYGNDFRLDDPAVRVGLISSVTFTNTERVLGTRFAANKKDELVIWDIDEYWAKLGAIPGCTDGIVSPDGRFVAASVSQFGEIELWPLPPPSPLPRLSVGVATIMGLLAAAAIWFLVKSR